MAPSELTLPGETHLRTLCALVAAATGVARLAAVRGWIATVEPPASRLHRRALATTLLDACRRLHTVLHEQRRIAHCIRCTPDWPLIAEFADEASDPRRTLERWASAFLASFDDRHPPSAADSAAAMIRECPSRAWRLTRLGDAVGLSSPALRRAFHERFGMTPVAYLHLVRARQAMGLCRGPLKVEAIALEVGYRSKKDLYHALARWVGFTPLALRRLTSDRWNAIERRLESMVVAGLPDAADRDADQPPMRQRRLEAGG